MSRILPPGVSAGPPEREFEQEPHPSGEIGTADALTTASLLKPGEPEPREAGTRRTAKLKMAQSFGLPSLPVDTLAASYIFLTPGRSYMVFYSQTPSGDYSADNLAYFDYMIQNTLKFTD